MKFLAQLMIQETTINKPEMNIALWYDLGHHLSLSSLKFELVANPPRVFSDELQTMAKD